MYHRGAGMDMSQRVCTYDDGIGEAKGRWGARRGFTGAGGANDVVYGAASDDGGTWMLEGTEIGDGELEGTEREFSAMDIYFESVSFY